MNKAGMAALARRAAEVIQKRGKATGARLDDKGRVCAVGALCVAAEEMEQREIRARSYLSHYTDAIQVVIVRAGKKVPAIWSCSCGQHDGENLVTWSDHRSTRAEDIAKLFNQIADEIEVEQD
jgi:hypothetical protein